METSAGEVCVWCDKEKAVSSIFDNGRPVYCEKCQRELLKEFGTPDALADWERTRKQQRNTITKKLNVMASSLTASKKKFTMTN